MEASPLWSGDGLQANQWSSRFRLIRCKATRTPHMTSPVLKMSQYFLGNDMPQSNKTCEEVQAIPGNNERCD